MMATTLLYITKPHLSDPAPGQNPDDPGLAWFGRWSSGHLCHMGQHDVKHAGANGVNAEQVTMSRGEYERLLQEAHWYEKA
jgi:hypothetical protein